MSEIKRLSDFESENNNLKDWVLENESRLHFQTQEHSKYIKTKVKVIAFRLISDLLILISFF